MQDQSSRIALQKHLQWSAMPTVDRHRINGILNPARNATLLALVGAPRGSFSALSQPIANPALRGMMGVQDLCGGAVQGLRPALALLQNALQEVAIALPHLYDRLTICRMLDCRLAKGSQVVISPHAWGVAVDFAVADLAPQTDPDFVPAAMFDMHRIFNQHGFYWGAAFHNPDPFHFEISDQLIRRWAREGMFGPDVAKWLPRGLTFADRGPQVVQLQTDLNQQLPFAIVVDGLYGTDTRAAVFEFQRRVGLPPDGVAGQATLRALAIANL